MIYFDDISILNIGHKARQIKKNGWKYKCNFPLEQPRKILQQVQQHTLPGVISPFSSASVIMLYPILHK
jgi:hypothetical protein